MLYVLRAGRGRADVEAVPVVAGSLCAIPPWAGDVCICGDTAAASAVASTTRSAFRRPLPSPSIIVSHFAMSLTDDVYAGLLVPAHPGMRSVLTPSHLPPTLRWPLTRFGRATKSSKRELCEVMPSGPHRSPARTEARPVDARGRGGRDAARGEGEVGVVVLLAETLDREEAQALEDLASVEAHVLEAIADVLR